MKQFLVFVALARVTRRGGPARAQFHLISAKVTLAVFGKKMIDFE
jgi:hypothetical protein